MLKRTSFQAFAVGVLFLTAACSDQNEPVAPSDQPESPLRSIAQGTAADPISLGRAVQGFGGFYLDAQGIPVIYLKDAAQRGNAERALAPYLQARGLAPARIRVLPAKYDWAQLEGWFSQASAEVLAVPGGVFVDADEAHNRVRIGVERGSAGRARSMLARLGIPDAAVIVEETEPVRFAVAPPKPKGPTLQSRVRPIVGGLQINFPGFLCTLGFNVVGGGQNSFITNSHCTDVQGGVEGTTYGQHLLTADPSPIATEVADPAYSAALPGCPAGRVCRRSDASRARYNNGVGFPLGGIAKTQRPGRSLVITGRFTITSDNDAVAVGQTVNKVGRTTGWSQGGVTAVCANTNVSGTNITQLCQNFVSATVGSGDSGSPVFAISGGDNVTLLGILWGGSGSNSFVYSPLTNVEQELGALTTF